MKLHLFLDIEAADAAELLGGYLYGRRMTDDELGAYLTGLLSGTLRNHLDGLRWLAANPPGAEETETALAALNLTATRHITGPRASDPAAQAFNRHADACEQCRSIEPPLCEPGRRLYLEALPWQPAPAPAGRGDKQ